MAGFDAREWLGEVGFCMTSFRLSGLTQTRCSAEAAPSRSGANRRAYRDVGMGARDVGKGHGFISVWIACVL